MLRSYETPETDARGYEHVLKDIKRIAQRLLMMRQVVWQRLIIVAFGPNTGQLVSCSTVWHACTWLRGKWQMPARCACEIVTIESRNRCTAEVHMRHTSVHVITTKSSSLSTSSDLILVHSTWTHIAARVATAPVAAGVAAPHSSPAAASHRHRPAIAVVPSTNPNA